jgi:hypothetical protein
MFLVRLGPSIASKKSLTNCVQQSMLFILHTWRDILVHILIQSSLQKRNCLTLLDPNRKNLFCKSQLTSIVAMGCQKPYSQTVGKSCICMMFSDSANFCCYWDQKTWNTFPGSEYRTVIEQ